jgi:hypothetical protein
MLFDIESSSRSEHSNAGSNDLSIEPRFRIGLVYSWSDCYLMSTRQDRSGSEILVRLADRRPLEPLVGTQNVLLLVPEVTRQLRSWRVQGSMVTMGLRSFIADVAAPIRLRSAIAPHGRRKQANT